MNYLPTFVPVPREATAAAIKTAILERLAYDVGKDPGHAVAKDWCSALSHVVRDHVVDAWIPSTRRTYADGRKRVYYLSMEFLVGRILPDAIANLGLDEACRAAVNDLGLDYEKILSSEADAALGNGGLGRLAACFLDSMSRLGIAGYGYGIRYAHGLFRQRIENGVQVEEPEDWLVSGHTWEFERPEVTYRINFGGHVAPEADGAPDGDGRGIWHPGDTILATAHDTPIAGWQGEHVNTLRLWAARPTHIFDLDLFNRGDHVTAAERAVSAETVSRILYPDDSTTEGKELRLKQEYFFTSASLQDLVRRFLSDHDDLTALPDHVAIQLNDTHPSIAVPELIRILSDEHGLSLVTAADITRRTVNYTNHTLLPEALERWPSDLFSRLLPRHMEIVRWLDQRHLAEAAGATAGTVGILDPDRLHPDRIVNQTNGITPRRWLYECNRPLRDLLIETIGREWVRDLETINAIEPLADDEIFRGRFADAKRQNKVRLAGEIKQRIVKADPCGNWTPRVKIIAGKAAPSYHVAKDIIRLINDVAAVVNNDPGVGDRLKVAFLPNYNVSLAEKIIPAADLSEQISTAGMEASGTGNMKLSLNGALTVGTLDGATVEIRDHVGAENIHIFGMSAGEVFARRAEGYDANATIAGEPRLEAAFAMIKSGTFSPDEPNRYHSLIDGLRHGDYFMVTADFAAYYDIQRVIDGAFQNTSEWMRVAILNTARMGWFSSDRTIRSYARDIWGVDVPETISGGG
ncbi:MAG: glycogen/starch/alpha-glucan phosphorylase [Alphaproteobacteria bacterium]